MVGKIDGKAWLRDEERQGPSIPAEDSNGAHRVMEITAIAKRTKNRSETTA